MKRISSLPKNHRKKRIPSSIIGKKEEFSSPLKGELKSNYRIVPLQLIRRLNTDINLDTKIDIIQIPLLLSPQKRREEKREFNKNHRKRKGKNCDKRKGIGISSQSELFVRVHLIFLIEQSFQESDHKPKASHPPPTKIQIAKVCVID